MVPTSTRAVVQVSKSLPASAEAVAVFVHKQFKAGDAYPSLPQAEAEVLGRLIGSGHVRGKSNEVTVQLLEGRTPVRLIVVGLGDREQFSAECLREGAAALARAAKKHRLSSVAVYLPAIPDNLFTIPGGETARPYLGAEAFTQGLLVGSFDYQEYHGTVRKSGDNAKSNAKPINFTIVSGDKGLSSAVETGRIVGESQNLARTIASRPGNNINPPSLAKVAQDLAREAGLKSRVLDEKDMKRLGMGGILGVGAGSSATPPRMIVLEYKSNKAKGAPLLVVGKSITFDSGGISIKPADKMGKMIFDKSGGMAVLGLMYAVSQLEFPVHVVGILASAENILSSTSYRPGDILTMYTG